MFLVIYQYKHKDTPIGQGPDNTTEKMKMTLNLNLDDPTLLTIQRTHQDHQEEILIIVREQESLKKLEEKKKKRRKNKKKIDNYFILKNMHKIL